jgi:asparagine synthase (glutamine-hydrolysing)
MCAICGIVKLDRSDSVDPATIGAMAETMAHRGPDDSGAFVDGPAGLGFRRLSIIDLSGGHQPMTTPDGDVTIVFNGEIYNYRDLTSELAAAGHCFQTRSDTEAILHAYRQYGDACVEHLRGMFAFAIWDRPKQRLLLARDRLGVKPVYYYQCADFLAFASEIKALLEIPAIAPTVDPDALDDYLSLRYVPGPRTMFRNIFRLQPGHTLVVESGQVRIRQYWDVAYGDSHRNPQDFLPLLEESVRLRLISDVPLGLFLSGGLDSTAILSIMSRLAGGRVKTFSVGYESSGARDDVSEFDYARLAANTFGAEHYEYHLTSEQFEKSIPGLIWHLDEPMADPTIIPLYHLSRLAREHITVVLSGEGADEILAGYNIYSRTLKVEALHRSPVLKPLAQLMKWAPSEALRHYGHMSAQPLNQRYRGVSRGFRPQTKLSLIGADRMHRSLLRLDAVFSAALDAQAGASPLSRMLYADTKIWLPDDLLVKADKMTMATGVELRVPFLDHHLVEFAAGLPDRAKLDGSTGKALLRQAMRGRVPDAVIDRPKKGFPVPLASWLRGPLRQFLREQLLDRQSACCAYLDRTAVSRILDQHEQGRTDRSGELWSLLVFEIWHRKFMGSTLYRRHAAA